jgi:uncharacterized integral membrane protein (TIGR00698 family)
VGPLLLALLVGCAVANLRGSSRRSYDQHATAAKLLLRAGVVLVGLRLSAAAVASLGVGGVAVALLTVAATFWATCALGDRLGLERGLVTLVAAGFSVCGAAAIAAVEGGVRRRNRDVALAVAMVTLFGTAMVVVLPLAADIINMPDDRMGVWAGASIHEVAQVVAASSVAGPVALAMATTVKLTRVAVLPMVYLVAGARHSAPVRGRRALPRIPWFVIGFVLAVGLRTSGVLAPAHLAATDLAATLFLAAGMYGLGLGLRARDLFPVPFRLLLLCTASTLTAAGLSGVLTLTLT